MQQEKKSKRILVICPHPQNVSPGQRLKYEQYFSYFEKNGYEITVSSFMTMPFWNIVYKKGHHIQKVLWTIFGYFKRYFDFIRIRKFDAVYIFLWVTPFGTKFSEWLTTILARKIIYDIDDLVFLKPASRANPLIRIFKSSEKNYFLMKKADHVITCTPYLDEFARKYNDNTTDISSTVDTSKWGPSDQGAEQITLGWTGSFSTSQYLKLLKDILIRLKEKYDINILVIGDPEFQIDGLDVEIVKWTLESEVDQLKRIDIGLYPLPMEDWVLGKSGLKAIQYMALGIPTVATKIGANHRVIEDGVSGFLVEELNEWEEKVSQLIENEELRKQVGQAARERAIELYSVEANKDTYLNIIKKVLSEG